ncbi:electron transfer flavoprotein subunit alpha/FixB family protein [Vibrio sp. 10N]|uniref:electron transfer flavoprotein subunit alpha/FixB family protein n=1 Tax=Vibrio sp. 10N TaxID=3058938 RepID=UPI0028139497|nr:FAD-binding protein [Vibrio sp. 10N]
MDSKTLIIAEHDNRQIAPDTLKTLFAASQIGGEIYVLVVGHEITAVAECLSTVEGVTQVLLVDTEQFTHPTAEDVAPIIVELSEGFTHFFAPATTFGKNLMPRVAAMLDVGQLSDVIQIESPDTVIRPIYAGNALARIKSNDSKLVMTIRGSAFDSANTDSQESSPVEVVEPQACQQTLASFVDSQHTISERPDLSSAKVVISGGRGLGSKENFALVERLADKLGGAIGASRAAVDAGFVSNDLQVGQTGKIVAPGLYMAIGISGAIQHMAGMKDSKVIVAINSDPAAAIFEVADYGLVGDLFEIMPELIEKLP